MSQEQTPAPRPCARCATRPRNEYGTYCEACDDLVRTIREVNMLEAVDA